MGAGKKFFSGSGNSLYRFLPNCLDYRTLTTLICHFPFYQFSCLNFLLGNYRVGKKTAPNLSCNNFGKYGPILIMFSLLHSQMN